NSAFQYGGKFGYQTDSDYNLKLLGHRYYDPTLGRFLSRDPVHEVRNWFAYCGGSPLSNIDDSGLTKIVLTWHVVFWPGYHAGIIIIDNEKGGTKPIYSFAGGPE